MCLLFHPHIKMDRWYYYDYEYSIKTHNEAAPENKIFSFEDNESSKANIYLFPIKQWTKKYTAFPEEIYFIS